MSIKLYTLEEISELSDEEFNYLWYFKGYQYSEIVGFNLETKEIKFRSGSLICENLDTLKNVQRGKIQYDLVQGLFQQVNDQDKLLKKSYESLEQDMNSVLSDLNTKIGTNITNTKTMTQDIKNQVFEVSKEMKSMFDETNSTINREIDTSDFRSKMKKIDKILDVFDKLVD